MFKGMFKIIKNQDRERKVKKKNLLIAIAIVVMLIAVTIATILTYNKKTQISQSVDAELLRAMTYEQFEEDSENVESTDNVKFSAFFLRDLNGDGFAEKIKGTCKETGSEDTLYLELNVLTEGYLKDGKITIDGKNFVYNTAILKDEVVSKNYIGITNEIKLNSEILCGTHKLIMRKNTT